MKEREFDTDSLSEARYAAPRQPLRSGQDERKNEHLSMAKRYVMQSGKDRDGDITKLCNSDAGAY